MKRTHTSTRIILIGLAFVALGLLLWQISDVLIITFGGIVGAAAWRGLAAPVARVTGWGERWCIGLVILVVFGSLTGAGWVFGDRAGEQMDKMQQTIPDALQRIDQRLEQSEMGRWVMDSTRKSVGDSNAVSHLGLAAGAALSAVTNGILMLFVSLYFALAPREYLQGMLRLLPPGRRSQVGAALEDAGAALQRWLMGQMIAMAVVGVAVGIGLALLGVPLAMLLGLIAMLLEFIPVVGPVLFALPGVLVAMTKDTHTVLYVILLYVAVQTLESNVLVPLLQRWAVRLPPVVSLLAALVGAVLFGPVGLIFASPLAVVVLALVKHLYVENTLENSRAKT